MWRKMCHIVYNYRVMTVSITQGCNLRCKYCQVSKNPNVMSWETLKKVLDWATQNVYRPYISFFGGEPLLEYEKIKWAIENYPNIGFGLSTNVTLLTPDKIKFFYDHNISLLLSIDGIGDVHNATRGGWDMFADRLPLLGELFPQAIFRLTITADNVSHLYETVKYGVGLGFKNFNALPDGMDETWTSEDYRVLKQELVKLHDDPYTRKVFQPFESYHYRMTEGDSPLKDSFQCCNGRDQISVLWDGRFSLCSEQTAEGNPFIVGDLDNGVSQEKIDTFWAQYQPCPIHCKAFPICSRERCFSRRYFCKGDLSEKIVSHCYWYNAIEEVVRND